VDEAFQLTEAVLSSALVLFDKFVLIEDHKQLPAVITQDNNLCKVESECLNQLGINDLRKSLFERLMDNAYAKGWTDDYRQLRDHYRMHEDIASLITRHYRAGLQAVLTSQFDRQPAYELPAGHFLREFAHHPVLFIETPGEGGPKK
jgi:DNA replication ATP-dependent helicase Dna2